VAETESNIEGYNEEVTGFINWFDL
jgi:hypothetical protein